MTDDRVTSILEARGQTHGAFSDNAKIAQALRKVIHSAPNWELLPDTQQLTLDEMMLKVARVLSRGAPTDQLEPWLDLAGYPTLIVNELKNQGEEHA